MNCIISIVISALHPLYSHDKLKEVVSGASGTNGEEEKCIEDFVLDILNERDHLEDLGIAENFAEDSGFWGMSRSVDL